MSRGEDFQAWCKEGKAYGGVTFQYNAEGHVCAVVKRIPLSLCPVYETLEQLESPYLPQILAIENKADCLLVTEAYIEGKTLRQVLTEEGPRSDASLLAMAKELCEALCLLHGQTPPIIHRDIKPENIILSADGHCVLIDFDAARQYTQEGKQDTVYLGTHGYAAPEQYGFSQTDARSDIFSLGATLYELRMGMPYKKGAACDGILGNIIAKCTQFDSVNRYQSANELMQALNGVGKRKPKGLLIVAGVLCVIGLATGIVLLSKPNNADGTLLAAAPELSPAAPLTPAPAANKTATPSLASAVPATPVPTAAPAPSAVPLPMALLTEEVQDYLSILPVDNSKSITRIDATTLEELQAALARALEEPDNSYMCIIQGTITSPANITVPANMDLTVNPGGELRMEENTALINNGYFQLDGTANAPGRLTLAPGATLYCRNEFRIGNESFCPRVIIENGILTLGANTVICREESPSNGSSSRLISIRGEISRIECNSPETVAFEGEGFIWIDSVSGCPQELLNKPAVKIIDG